MVFFTIPKSQCFKFQSSYYLLAFGFGITMFKKIIFYLFKRFALLFDIVPIDIPSPIIEIIIYGIEKFIKMGFRFHRLQ